MDTITEDGILLLIISLLPLRDAVRTCVLSRRWRHIWTHLPKLHFDAPNMFDDQTLRSLKLIEGTEREKLLMEKTEQFIASVNSVLQQHRGTAIEEVKVQYFLKKSHSHNLDAWVRFVVQSNSKKLILNLRKVHAIGVENDDLPDLYDFPCQFLGSSPIEHLSLSCCYLKMLDEFDGLICLKLLCLDRVDVTEDNVRRLLSNCFSLERLIVEDCPQLVTLSVSQPLSRLKYLRVFNAVYTNGLLTKIEFNAINLVKLEFWGNPVEFVLRESSQLTNATLSVHSDVDFELDKLTEDLPYLEYLSFDIWSDSNVVARLANNSSRFVNLRHLELNYAENLRNARGCLYLASLLSAAPFMEKFTMKYSRWHFSSPKRMGVKPIKLRSPSLHSHLKTVEIKEFTGDKWQIISAVYLLNCATELESIVLYRKENVCVDKRSRKIFERNMEYLRQEVAINVQVVVL